MDVSVIIVNYNVRGFLSNALTSLQKALDGFSSEIFVVDNASDDGSVELLRRDFPGVHLIANTANVGFARANNQALARSGGRYLLLINPDTLVQEDTVAALVRYFERDPKAGMVGCKILNPDGSLQLPCRRSFPTPWTAFTKTFGLSSLFPNSRLFARYNLTYLDPDGTYEVDAVSGSFMMVRREVYDAIGGLDEEFFMYGEDLDWCYRVQKAGWKVMYVPATSIIHYKGESTKRSDIDELKVFYNAMRLFVRKHHARSSLFEWFIYSGIGVRKFLADAGRFLRPFPMVAADMTIVALTILAGEYVRKGALLTLPEYAYPWAFLIPALIVAGALAINGLYSRAKLSVSRSFAAVFVGFVVISAVVAFEKDFAFSRMIMLISGALSLVLIPGWRLLLRLLGAADSTERATLFGRRTVIVGTGPAATDMLKKLRARAGGGYSVVGFVDINRKRIGETVADVPIIGSVETLNRLVEEHRLSEVIFSSDAVPYATILRIIAGNRSRFVNFRLVPTNLEVIIGKPNIDQLGELPLIELDYNIAKLPNRMAKRLFDAGGSLFLLISYAPLVYFTRLFTPKRASGAPELLRRLPSVLAGRWSFVGFSAETEGGNRSGAAGKPGITGLVQVHDGGPLTPEEREQFDLYYAKNQSFMLDLEIIVKTLQRRLRRP